MKQLRLAVVGCGDIASFTALVSRLVPSVKLIACCDPNEERARAFARRHRIPQVFTQYADLLAKATVDAVYLAVPHDLHDEMIRSAVHAQKPVLVEKPFTRTLSEGMDLIRDVKGAKVGVNYQYRYDRGCYALARAMQSQALGRVHSIRINIPWHREHAYFTGAPWHRTIARAGGGTLITQGSHFLDVAIWGLGELPVSSIGYIATPIFDVEVETLAHGVVKTSSGTLISITASMVAASEQPVTIEVYGEQGTAMYRDLPFPSTKFIGARIAKQRPPEWGVHALQRSLTGFAKWILEDKPFLIPAESTLPVLAAVDAIYRSAKSGQETEVNLRQIAFDH